jgi:hypothetical protein
VAAEFRPFLVERLRRDPGALADGDLGGMFEPAVVLEVRHRGLHEAVDDVRQKLVELGAGDEGFVLASNTSHRGVESLRWFTRDVIGWQPLNLISCVSGVLAFFEDYQDRHVILRRPSGTPDRG